MGVGDLRKWLRFSHRKQKRKKSKTKKIILRKKSEEEGARQKLKNIPDDNGVNERVGVSSGIEEDLEAIERGGSSGAVISSDGGRGRNNLQGAILDRDAKIFNNCIIVRVDVSFMIL